MSTTTANEQVWRLCTNVYLDGPFWSSVEWFESVQHAARRCAGIVRESIEPDAKGTHEWTLLRDPLADVWTVSLTWDRDRTDANGNTADERQFDAYTIKGVRS